MEKQIRAGMFSLGMLLLAVGVVLLLAQVLTTLVTVFILGLALIAGGVLEVIHGFSARRRGSSTFFAVLGGLLNLVLGLFLVMNPAISAISLTLVIAAFMIAQGIYRVI